MHFVICFKHILFSNLLGAGFPCGFAWGFAWGFPCGFCFFFMSSSSESEESESIFLGFGLDWPCCGGPFPGCGGPFVGWGGPFPGWAGTLPDCGGPFAGWLGGFPGWGGAFPGCGPTLLCCRCNLSSSSLSLSPLALAFLLASTCFSLRSSSESSLVNVCLLLNLNFPIHYLLFQIWYTLINNKYEFTFNVR